MPFIAVQEAEKVPGGKAVVDGDFTEKAPGGQGALDGDYSSLAEELRRVTERLKQVESKVSPTQDQGQICYISRIQVG